jgi:hypothetical protein
MHPMLEEFCRAQPQAIRPEVFRRWQRTIRDDIAPKLEDREALLEEIARLRATVDQLRESAPVKRGPGRPRKHPEPVTA